MRRTLLALGVASIVAALLVVPLPLTAIEPGSAQPVTNEVSLARPAGPLDGRLLLTTVRLHDPTTAQAVADKFRDGDDLVSRRAIIPPGVDDKPYLAAQRQLFQESAEVAAAVGLRMAGYAVEATGGGARVVAVIKGSPADGDLREGDVITAVNGHPVTLASDVAVATARAKAGDRVTLSFERGDEQRTVTIKLAPVSELGRPAIGVALETLGFHVQAPVGMTIHDNNIGGPSAGLMIALTIYDLASPDDLARARTVAGTGTIDLAGNVGPVGGVRQKVKAAEQAGAEMFLVPADQAGDARHAAHGRLSVVAVRTVRDAVSALMNGQKRA